MIFKQKKIKFKPRIKLNHNKSIKKTTDMLDITLRQQYFYFPQLLMGHFSKIICHVTQKKEQDRNSISPILLHCYGPLRAFDQLYVEYKLSALLIV